MARILIIAYTAYARDGRVKRQAEALSSRGDQVDVLCLADEQLADTNGVTVIELRVPRYRGANRMNYLRSYINFFSRAAALAVRRSLTAPYDVVIACTMPDAAILSALPCRLFGSKLVLDVHDTMPELYLDKFSGRHGHIGAGMLMLQERFSAWLADLVLAVHDLHAERLHQSGVPLRKLVVIANAPDPRIFPVAGPDRRFACAESKPDDGPFSIVCHGTISRRLGLDTALAALALLHGRFPLIRLRVIGGGDYLNELKTLSRRLGIESAVSFENPVPIQELAVRLGESHVGLVPNRASRATHLMLPVKLLEYVALGMPVICARLRTVEHYFSEKSLRFFSSNNAEELAEAMQDLYLIPALRRSLSNSAAKVVNTLSWPVHSQRFCDAVDSLLKIQEE
ncbi:MAG TPA: glycosyltransferase family 4 protein [Candidatus Acidoferrales bacterium]|nr:glycosyltransferase family 4 protein [Candidatus Acidoferrales bacterium]